MIKKPKSAKTKRIKPGFSPKPGRTRELPGGEPPPTSSPSPEPESASPESTKAMPKLGSKQTKAKARTKRASRRA